MWLNIIKGLHMDGELEIANSDKSGNESEAVDSVEWVDSYEPNFMKAKQIGRKPKPTPK